MAGSDDDVGVRDEERGCGSAAVERFQGKRRGDFTPPQRAEDGAGSGLNRSRLGSTTEQARIDDGASSD